MNGLRAIWAQSLDGVIGDGTTMPWHVPEDLAYFRDNTRGHTVVMGSNTWNSLPEEFRPLPGRTNIVLTSRPAGDWSKGATVIHFLEDIPADAIIIGGGALYASTLPLVDEVIVTEFNAQLLPTLGDKAVCAPSLDGFTRTHCGEWNTSKNGYIKQGDTHAPVAYRFSRYERTHA